MRAEASRTGPAIQGLPLGLGLLAAAALYMHLSGAQPLKAPLFLIGLAMGLALYQAAFGFTGAYRQVIINKDMTGIIAQAVMLGLAMLLFAPFLAAGEAFGRPVGGAVAPVGISMAFGAFLFGIGMQLGGGCASGTLFTAGGGSLRMIIVLIFFCLGCFWATFHMGWWWTLPEFGSISLAKHMGWPVALALQAALLGGIVAALYAWGARPRQSLGFAGGFSWRRLLQGPWPLLLAAIALAALNWATLVNAGHPWSITWGFTLWAAKAATLLGWEYTTASFWVDGFPERALRRPLLADTTTVMNMGILIGAFAAAALAGRLKPTVKIPLGSLAAAVIGGLVMGYGARLAYGCNIGAFFSGVASTSLHGWVWIAAAAAGNVIGVKLRPRFGLTN